MAQDPRPPDQPDPSVQSPPAKQFRAGSRHNDGAKSCASATAPMPAPSAILRADSRCCCLSSNKSATDRTWILYDVQPQRRVLRYQISRYQRQAVLLWAEWTLALPPMTASGLELNWILVTRLLRTSPQRHRADMFSYLVGLRFLFGKTTR